MSLASASPMPWKLEGLGAHAAFMTPGATPPNLMIYGPGGYQFGDYWKLGLLCVVWFGVVVIVGAPLVWKF